MSNFYMNKNFLAVALCSAVILFVPMGMASPDVRLYVSGALDRNEEFAPAKEVDLISIQRRWKYVLRYIHNDPDPKKGIAFALAVTRAESASEYNVALYEGPSSTLEIFDAETDVGKLKMATGIWRVDKAFADILYETWLSALFRASLGHLPSLTNASELYYISAYTVDRGYLSAYANEFVPEHTTGRIREIGLAIREGIRAGNPAERQRVRKRIEEMCLEVRRRGTWLKK